MALEHTLTSRRQGIEDRLSTMRDETGKQQYLYLGDYVAGGSPENGFDSKAGSEVSMPHIWKNHVRVIGATRAGKTAIAPANGDSEHGS